MSTSDILSHGPTSHCPFRKGVCSCCGVYYPPEKREAHAQDRRDRREQQVWLNKLRNERPEAGNTPTSDNGMPRADRHAKQAADGFALGVKLSEDYLPERKG